MSEVSCAPSDLFLFLLNLDSSKANGPDNISNRTLKSIANEISIPLSNLFNKFCETNKYPDKCYPSTQKINIDKLN